MDFKIIKSGKEKPQLIVDGYRLRLNKGPQGPLRSSYFKCVKCKATAAAQGPLEPGEFVLKFHHKEKHTCVLVAEKLAEFRAKARECPDKAVKVVFEEIATEVLNDASTVDTRQNRIGKKASNFW
jgi:hypothetical protein